MKKNKDMKLDTDERFEEEMRIKARAIQEAEAAAKEAEKAPKKEEAEPDPEEYAQESFDELTEYTESEYSDTEYSDTEYSDTDILEEEEPDFGDEE